MSINQKTVEFLKELHSTNPSTQAIELEFMQIAELVPFLPLLGRFSNLKRLSLHGNRIKELPVDMSQLYVLEELDISNNMLSNCDMMIMSLRTLPKLTRLVCPFKKEDEEKIKRGLHTLEFLNNSKIIRQKPKPKEQPQKQNSYELKPEDIESSARLFDDIRQLFRISYEQLDETDMVKEFNQEVESLLSDMKDSIGEDTRTSETMRSIIFLTTKYSLYKTPQTKIVNFLYDVDQKYGSVVDELFQNFGRIMKDMTDVAMEAQKRAANALPAAGAKQSFDDGENSAKDTVRFEKYEKEVRRLRKQRDQLQSDILALEAENKKYLDTLVRHSKGDRNLLYSVNSKRVDGSSPRKTATAMQTNNPIKPMNASQSRAPRQMVVAPNSKAITLKQLKDTIEEIYDSKVKFDQKAYESRLPRQTMYQYLFTFLNQKYGLKNLTIEWASSIVSGIQSFSNEDNDVAVFGKILRNECDEQFRHVQAEVKSTIFELLKVHMRTRHPLKTASELNELVQDKVANFISSEQCEDIVKYMYNEDDSNDLIDKLKMIYALQPTKNEQAGKRYLTRQQQNQLQNEHHRKRIRYQSFVKCVLDYQLRSHEKYLKPLIQGFRRVDKDADGIVNEQEFNQLLQSMCESAEDLAQRFLNMVDPYSTNTITFTQVCKLFSNFPEGEPVLNRFLKENQQ